MYSPITDYRMSFTRDASFKYKVLQKRKAFGKKVTVKARRYTDIVVANSIIFFVATCHVRFFDRDEVHVQTSYQSVELVECPTSFVTLLMLNKLQILLTYI